MAEQSRESRRGFLASALMWGGLAAAYGVLGVQSLLFILPKRTGPKTRFLFLGRTSEFKPGTVRSVQDLEGTPVLIRSDGSGLHAYSSICPHLGCRVRWEGDEHRFFCPCHRGVFDEEGRAVSGPPADAGQNLFEVPLRVDETAGVVYMEVKDVRRGNA